jgi:hypothetical protein
METLPLKKRKSRSMRDNLFLIVMCLTNCQTFLVSYVRLSEECRLFRTKVLSFITIYPYEPGKHQTTKI